MNKSYVELTEYESKDVELSRDQLQVLYQAAPSISVRYSNQGENYYKLRPDSHIGVINTPELQLLIKPKISISNTMFLMGYSLDIDDWGSGFEYEETDSLLEAIVPGLVLNIRDALQGGILHGYKTQEDSLFTVRGRMNLTEQIRRRFGVAFPAEVIYDEFTQDVEENRLIKAALNRLKNFPIRSRDLRLRLNEFDHLLDEVSLVEYHASNLPEITYTTLNQRYKRAVEISKLVLRNTSFDLSAGTSYSSLFIVDMNDVFQDFVTVALRESLGLNKRSFRSTEGSELKLDHDGKRRIEPDLTWWDAGRCVFVGDVKYKKTTNNQGSNPDIYQVLSYSISTDLFETMLIYAKGEEDPTTYRVGDPPRKIDVRALDLSTPQEHILNQIDVIASDIRGFRRRAQLVGAA